MTVAERRGKRKPSCPEKRGSLDAKVTSRFGFASGACNRLFNFCRFALLRNGMMVAAGPDLVWVCICAIDWCIVRAVCARALCFRCIELGWPSKYAAPPQHHPQQQHRVPTFLIASEKVRDALVLHLRLPTPPSQVGSHIYIILCTRPFPMWAKGVGAEKGMERRGKRERSDIRTMTRIVIDGESRDRVNARIT
ncbi:peptidase C1A papain [Anopheles sinensis]|uniref:Peptidase C1A papain n=1 Tax=Anopheles sinensis TaxID=74873 RepID=A0A084W7I9_ANOSI|nr:peptidase C1A papain [Anopheles sinensis]